MASLAVLVDTVARQQIDIKRLTENIKALKKKGGSVTDGVPGTEMNNSPQYKHCALVGRTDPYQNNKCYLNTRKNNERMG